MSDRTDQKLREVAVAWYAFRHEAEFAAGFLDDARIPYRMQVDDPILGSGISSNATIWVLGMHERQAREVLDLDGEPAYLSGGPARRGHRRSPDVRPVRRPTAPSRPPRRPSHGTGPAVDGAFPWIVPALSLRERGLALLGGAGTVGILRLFLREGMHPIVSGAAVLVAASLVVAGIAGWAPGPLRRLLRALSGGAP